MSIFRVEGIVLKTSIYKETSRIITLLTPDKGKLVCIGHNSQQLQSSNAATFQVGNYIEVVLYQKLENTHMSTVTQAKIKRQFQKTKGDLVKLALSQYSIEVINKNTEDGEENLPLYKILYNALTYIEDNEVNLSWKTTFDYFVLVRLGFQPVIDTCVVTGVNLNEGIFDIREGGLTDKSLKRRGYFMGKRELDYFSLLVKITPYSKDIEVPKNVKLAIEQMMVEYAFGPFVTLKYYGMS